jgi:hypothetical protein
VSLTQVPLSGVAAALIGVGALVVTSVDIGWRIIRHGAVMAHEGAHAVVGSLLAHHVTGVKLNRDATGSTGVRSARGVRGHVFYFAGYTGPSAFGLGAARLIEFGHVVAVLWVTLFLLGLLLTGIRMSFGLMSVILAGALVFAAARYMPMADQKGAAYGVTWLLLLTGVRGVLTFGVAASDAAVLATRTIIPRLLWFLLWLAAALAAVAVGGSMLILHH